MTSLGTIARDALKAVWKRQNLALANLTGNALLLFLFYSWFSNPDRSGSNLVGAVFWMLVGAFFGFWLHATTLATFHTDAKETPFVPVLRRFPGFLPWIVAEVLVIALFGWLGSAVSFIFWVPAVAGVLALLPMVSQAAGEGFSKDSALRIITNEQYWLASTLLIVFAVYLPYLIVTWMPESEGIWISMFEKGVSLGLACVFTIVSWVMLAALIGEMGIQAEKKTISHPPQSDQPAPVFKQ